MRAGRFARTLAALVAPFVLIGVLYSMSGSQAQKAGRQEVAAPDSWVPFSAVVHKLTPGKTTDVIGRLYRASDGSRRLESGPPGRRQAVVSITSFTRLGHYLYSDAHDGWIVVPFAPGDNARLPPKLAVDNQKTFLHGDKVEGYDVLRAVDQGTQIRLIAPALNGESLLRQQLDGTREVLSEIVVGEQPASLFEPPPGAVLKEAPEGLLKPPVAPDHKESLEEGKPQS